MIAGCLALVAAMLSVAVPGPATGAAARSFPDSRARILIFADQLPGQMTDAQMRFAASHYVGSQKMTRTWTRQMRRINPRFLMLHYQLAVGAGPAPFLDGDNWVNDFADVTKHEDWFMHDAQGHRLLQPDWNWDVMDIRFNGDRPRTGFPAYWLESALKRMRDEEADGCFADSYTQDILINQLRPTPPLFHDIELTKRDWLPHLNRYGEYCAAGFHRAPERFYYLPNLGGLVTGWDNVTDLNVGDGGMNEGFCASGPGSYLSTDDWKLQMTRVLGLAARGKILLCQTGTDPASLDHRWFVVGSYLLTKGPRSYLNMIHKSSLEWYPEYDVDLGPYAAPPRPNVNDYWRADWGLFRRDYANGFVVVNPTAQPVTVSDLGGAFALETATGGGAVGEDGKASGSLRTESIHSLVVPAHSARVLLHTTR